jgi:broad specificity phosphatase PhoE
VKKQKMPRDPNQRAFETMRIALGESDEPVPDKDPERVERGKLGGSKGGKLRAERLSPERRTEIARQAAEARWALARREA